MIPQYIKLLDKTYSGESIIDAQEDVEECTEYGEGQLIPKDEYGFHKGTFRVRVTWEPTEE